MCLLHAAAYCQMPANNVSQVISDFNQLLNKSFPELLLSDEQDNIFNTSSLQGKTIYVDFWFTQCPPCIAQIPYAQELKAFFANDTNIVFLNICIDNKERKETWKQMILQKGIKGINLFYAKNQPQKVNLIREYKVENFPTYMLVDDRFKIIGYNAPMPSDKNLVEWSIFQAAKNRTAADSYLTYINKSEAYLQFLQLLNAAKNNKL